MPVYSLLLAPSSDIRVWTYKHFNLILKYSFQINDKIKTLKMYLNKRCSKNQNHNKKDISKSLVFNKVNKRYHILYFKIIGSLINPICFAYFP